MGENTEQVLSRISAVIAGLALDAVAEARESSPRDPMDEVFDQADFENQVHRILRDECKELWEKSAAEVTNANLAMLVRRLCRKVYDDDLKAKALDYLRRTGLQGDIMREGEWGDAK